MKFYTYAHYTKDTKELFYIGKGVGKRFKQNCRFTRSKWWANKIDKHGGFEAKILAYWDTEQEALEHEKFLISCLKGSLVNLTDGGEGLSGFKQSEESKKKRSESLKGKPLTEQRKQNISKSLTGRKLSKEHLEKSINTLKAFREKQKTKVVCITTGILYPSVSEASLQTGVDASSIVKVCKGKALTAGKKEWCYG